jgi:hypothetical protein
MNYDIETARRYRMHAARLRRTATDEDDPRTRETLMQIAQDYERMAQGREGTEGNNVTYLSAGTANHKR